MHKSSNGRGDRQLLPAAREAKRKYTSLTTTHAKDFWAQVAKQTDGCWEWRGSFNEKKIPVFFVKGRPYPAYRIAWCLDHDMQLPSHYWIRHRCSTTACVRPDHLQRVRRAAPKPTSRHKNPVVNIMRPPNGGTPETRHLPKPGWSRVRQQREIKEIKALLGAVGGAVRQMTGHYSRSLEDVTAIRAELKGFSELIIQRLDSLDGRLKGLEDRWAIPILPVDPHAEELVDCLVDEQVDGIAKKRPLEKKDPPEVRGGEVPAIPEHKEKAPDQASKARTEHWRNEPSDESGSHPTPVPPPEPEEESPPDGLTPILASAFADVLGNQALREDDHLDLRFVFDLAMQETGSSEAAVGLFVQWLGDFSALVQNDANAPRSPVDFRKAVVTRP